MNKKYLKPLLVLGFAALAACQSVTTKNLFNPFPSDERISASVHETFMHNPALASLPIHIETHGGVVSLNGYVKTIRQSDTAGDMAAKVAGVKSVDNELIVRK